MVPPTISPTVGPSTITSTTTTTTTTTTWPELAVVVSMVYTDCTSSLLEEVLTHVVADVEANNYTVYYSNAYCGSVMIELGIAKSDEADVRELFKRRKIRPKIDGVAIEALLLSDDQYEPPSNSTCVCPANNRKRRAQPKCDTETGGLDASLVPVVHCTGSLDRTEIPPFVLKSVVDVDLSANAISVVRSGAFCGMTKLQSLDLSRNRITKIAAHAFDDCAHMTFVDFSWNSISMVEHGWASGLTAVQSTQVRWAGNILTCKWIGMLSEDQGPSDEEPCAKCSPCITTDGLWNRHWGCFDGATGVGTAEGPYAARPESDEHWTVCGPTQAPTDSSVWVGCSSSISDTVEHMTRRGTQGRRASRAAGSEYDQIPGVGWCTDASGAEFTARKYIQFQTLEETKDHCTADLSCVAIAFAGDQQRSAIYTDSGCTINCDNTAWLVDRELIVGTSNVEPYSCYVKVDWSHAPSVVPSEFPSSTPTTSPTAIPTEAPSSSPFDEPCIDNDVIAADIAAAHVAPAMISCAEVVYTYPQICTDPTGDYFEVMRFYCPFSCGLCPNVTVGNPVLSDVVGAVYDIDCATQTPAELATVLDGTVAKLHALTIAVYDKAVSCGGLSGLSILLTVSVSEDAYTEVYNIFFNGMEVLSPQGEPLNVVLPRDPTTWPTQSPTSECVTRRHARSVDFARLVELFTLFDAGYDNKLQEEELRDALRVTQVRDFMVEQGAILPADSTDAAAIIFPVLDLNQDGDVPFKEFVKAISTDPFAATEPFIEPLCPPISAPYCCEGCEGDQCDDCVETGGWDKFMQLSRPTTRQCCPANLDTVLDGLSMIEIASFVFTALSAISVAIGLASVFRSTLKFCCGKSGEEIDVGAKDPEGAAEEFCEKTGLEPPEPPEGAVWLKISTKPFWVCLRTVRIAIAGEPLQIVNHAVIPGNDDGDGDGTDEVLELELVPLTPPWISYINPILMLPIAVIVIYGSFYREEKERIDCFPCKYRNLWDDPMDTADDISEKANRQILTLCISNIISVIAAFSTTASGDPIQSPVGALVAAIMGPLFPSKPPPPDIELQRDNNGQVKFLIKAGATKGARSPDPPDDTKNTELFIMWTLSDEKSNNIPEYGKEDRLEVQGERGQFPKQPWTAATFMDRPDAEYPGTKPYPVLTKPPSNDDPVPKFVLCRAIAVHVRHGPSGHNDKVTVSDMAQLKFDYESSPAPPPPVIAFKSQGPLDGLVLKANFDFATSTQPELEYIILPRIIGANDNADLLAMISNDRIDWNPYDEPLKLPGPSTLVARTVSTYAGTQSEPVVRVFAAAPAPEAPEMIDGQIVITLGPAFTQDMLQSCQMYYSRKTQFSHQTTLESLGKDVVECTRKISATGQITVAPDEFASYVGADHTDTVALLLSTIVFVPGSFPGVCTGTVTLAKATPPTITRIAGSVMVETSGDSEVFYSWSDPPTGIESERVPASGKVEIVNHNEPGEQLLYFLTKAAGQLSRQSVQKITIESVEMPVASLSGSRIHFDRFTLDGTLQYSFKATPGTSADDTQTLGDNLCIEVPPGDEVEVTVYVLALRKGYAPSQSVLQYSRAQAPTFKALNGDVHLAPADGTQVYYRMDGAISTVDNGTLHVSDQTIKLDRGVTLDLSWLAVQPNCLPMHGITSFMVGTEVERKSINTIAITPAAGFVVFYSWAVMPTNGSDGGGGRDGATNPFELEINLVPNGPTRTLYLLSVSTDPTIQPYMSKQTFEYVTVPVATVVRSGRTVVVTPPGGCAVFHSWDTPPTEPRVGEMGSTSAFELELDLLPAIPASPTEQPAESLLEPIRPMGDFEAGLRKIFNKLDQSDGQTGIGTRETDRKLDYSELKFRLPAKELAAELDKVGLLRLLDVNGDGNLDVNDLLSTLDSDGDRKLSISEFVLQLVQLAERQPGATAAAEVASLADAPIPSPESTEIVIETKTLFLLTVSEPPNPSISSTASVHTFCAEPKVESNDGKIMVTPPPGCGVICKWDTAPKEPASLDTLHTSLFQLEGQSPQKRTLNMLTMPMSASGSSWLSSVIIYAKPVAERKLDKVSVAPEDGSVVYYSWTSMPVMPLVGNSGASQRLDSAAELDIDCTTAGTKTLYLLAVPNESTALGASTVLTFEVEQLAPPAITVTRNTGIGDDEPESRSVVLDGVGTIMYSLDIGGTKTPQKYTEALKIGLRDEAKLTYYATETGFADSPVLEESISAGVRFGSSENSFPSISIDIQGANVYYQWGKADDPAPSLEPSTDWMLYTSQDDLQVDFEASHDAPGTVLWAKHDGDDSQFPNVHVLGTVATPSIEQDEFDGLAISCDTPGATIYRRWARTNSYFSDDERGSGSEWVAMVSTEELEKEMISKLVIDLCNDELEVMLLVIARRSGMISSGFGSSTAMSHKFKVNLPQCKPPKAGPGEMGKIELESKTAGCTIKYRFVQTDDTKPFGKSEWATIANGATPVLPLFIKQQIIERDFSNDEVIIEAVAMCYGHIDSAVGATMTSMGSGKHELCPKGYTWKGPITLLQPSGSGGAGTGGAYMHGPISRAEAEAAITAAGLENGRFLVRSLEDKPDQYVISVVSKGRISHFLAVKTNGAVYAVNEQTYDGVKTIDTLVSHLQTRTRRWPQILDKPVAPGL